MEGSNPETLTARDKRVSSDTAANFVGTVRVWIKHLDFPHPSRQVDPKVIAQLKRDFDGEGCNPEKLNNRIPAIIHDPMLLRTMLERLAISAETFKAMSKENPPHLNLGQGVKLECLHGQHRAFAANEYLPPSRRWWVVDLYNTG